MEWKRAKNYTIVFLIIINVIFLILNVAKRSEYRLSTSDITAVSQVIEDRGIILNCDLPRDFSPMGQLYMREFGYDNLELQEIFFGSISGVRRVDVNDDIIFSRDNNTLTVARDSVSFSGTLETQPADIESAGVAVKEYVDALNDYFGDYSLNISSETGEGYYFEYRQSFQNQLVFSNYLKAWVDSNGSIQLIFNYQQPLEYKGTREDIISADEAVYAASRLIDDDFTTASVDGVEKGYFLVERYGSGELAAVPQYKIYVNGGGASYYVNAYSGDATVD